MKKLFTAIITIIRFLILGRIIYLLYKTSVDTTNYPLDTLTWWIYFLVFEIWVSVSFTVNEDKE